MMAGLRCRLDTDAIRGVGPIAGAAIGGIADIIADIVGSITTGGTNGIAGTVVIVATAAAGACNPAVTGLPATDNLGWY